MCKCNGESVDHLLLQCPTASNLHSLILGLFGVYWVMPKSVFELLACWEGQFGHHWNGHIWMVIPHCLMWCIWRERNNRSFEDMESFMPDLKFFFRTLLDWLSDVEPFLFFFVFFPIVDLLDLCNFCNWLFTLVYFMYTWVIRFPDLHNFITYKKKKCKLHLGECKKKKKAHQIIFLFP